MAHTKVVLDKIDFFDGAGAQGEFYFYESDVNKVLYENVDKDGNPLVVKTLYALNAIIHASSGTVTDGVCTVLVGVTEGGFDEDGVILPRPGDSRPYKLLINEGNIIALSCPPFRDFPNGGTFIDLNNETAFILEIIPDKLDSSIDKLIAVINK